MATITMERIESKVGTELKQEYEYELAIGSTEEFR